MKRLIAILTSSVCVSLLAPSTSALAQQQKWTPMHVAKIRSVLSAQISPDGKQIAYLLSVPRDIPKEKDGGAWTQLHVVNLKGESRPYVSGDVNVGSIAWTPDGRSISFLAKRDGDKQRSLYVIPLDGGEARKILEHSTSIGSYSWSPSGKQVAFLAAQPRSKKEEKLRAEGFNQEIYEEDFRPIRVWIATIGSDEKPRMLKLKGSASELHWSPAGDKLALALAPTPLIDEHYMFRKVRIVDAKTGKITAKLDNPGKMAQLAWSPDGKHVALIAGVDKHDPREGRLWVALAAGGKWRDYTPDYSGHVTSIAWQDNNIVTFVGAEGVWTTFKAVDLKSGDIKALLPTKGPILHNVSLSSDGKVAAFVADTPKHPQEVYALQVGTSKKPKRLTFDNPWLENMRFAKQEVVHHVARDGLKLEGILIRPLDEKPGQRYPLVLTVHGGPESHVPNGWVTRYAYLGQVGASNGMAVFYPNYRGSTGRGVEFSMMGQKDAAGKEFDDLVDAVDHLIKIGLVDKNKVGITGGSYGGYASAWGATFYSDRFAASVMFVGISDGVSKVGTTDIPWEMFLVHHRKWLWDDWKYFLKSSPIYYVQKAHTPLLILHGKNDPRVHPGQSMELFRHLKILGKTPVRLVFYPGEGHGNRRAASRLDYNLRLLRWMKHFLEEGGKKKPPYAIQYPFEKKSASK